MVNCGHKGMHRVSNNTYTIQLHSDHNWLLLSGPKCCQWNIPQTITLPPAWRVDSFDAWTCAVDIKLRPTPSARLSRYIQIWTLLYFSQTSVAPDFCSWPTGVEPELFLIKRSASVYFSTSLRGTCPRGSSPLGTNGGSVVSSRWRASAMCCNEYGRRICYHSYNTLAKQLLRSM